MNSQVFREYDIRGVVSNDFDDAFVTDLGRGYATLLHRAGKKTVTLAAIAACRRTGCATGWPRDCSAPVSI